MEQELEQEAHPDYLKGFNEGYLLRQHNPELANSLSKSLEQVQDERASGFAAGCSQYDKEREQVMTVSWMKKLPENYDDILPEKDMNMDDLNPEKE